MLKTDGHKRYSQNGKTYSRKKHKRHKDGAILGNYFADLLVEDFLIIELKACKALADEHLAQVLGYLRASGKRHALLINFVSAKLEKKNLFFDLSFLFFCDFAPFVLFAAKSFSGSVPFVLFVTVLSFRSYVS